MFWGLIMEPKRRYTQKVKQPFHISMAALDIFSADDEPTQLMLHFEERNYLLCTLQKGQQVQCSLDLNFEAGDEIAFATNGHSNVHLSGYLQEELDDLMGEQEAEEEEEDEESEVKIETKNKKRKVENNVSQAPQKKSKLAKLLEKTYDSEDDESFALPDDLEEEEVDLSEDGDDDEEVEEEEGEEDDESGEEEEDSNEEGVSSLSGDDEEEEIKPKQNGVASKKKNKEALKKALRNEQNQQSPKAMIKTPKGEKMEKTPSKQEKLEIAQRGNKTPKGEKTPKSNKTPNQKEAKTPASPNQQNATPQKRNLEGGVMVQDLKVGEGQTVKSGKMVQVYYEGRLKQNNKVFDHNTKGSGFKFRLGRQEVIKGWDVGVVGMKVGGKRRITCPPNMAYGNKGSPPVIPPNSTLVFEVELKNIL